MTQKEEKIVKKNLKRISKEAEKAIEKFCNGVLAKGVTSSSLSKALR